MNGTITFTGDINWAAPNKQHAVSSGAVIFSHYRVFYQNNSCERWRLHTHQLSRITTIKVSYWHPLVGRTRHFMTEYGDTQPALSKANPDLKGREATYHLDVQFAFRVVN